MRVGLDIDNVITDFDEALLDEYLIEDKKKRNKGIINPYARHITRGMFDWSDKEVEEFYEKNMERIAKTLKVKKDAKYYMDKLLSEGKELYLISHRAYPHYLNPYETTYNWLKENNINYTKLVLSKSIDKSRECIENGIDIMFDDGVSNCLYLRDNNVNNCLFLTKFNKIYKKDLPSVKDWKQLYERVNSMNKTKNVILDTDMYNEVDDQFALTYLMNSLDKVNVEAITIAPFSGSGYANTNSIEEGTIKSYETTLKLLDMLNKKEYKNKVYKGAIKYFKDSKEDNDAVDKIIEIANKNEKTTIIAIGAITNIALAITKDPSIINKIEVIWLGGNSFLSHQNREFNFKQDIEAVKTVFDSKVDLTVIPCRNVASNLVTTSYELENYLKDSEIGNYLCDIFKNVKKNYYKNETDEYGSSKTLWDLSAVAYAINSDWFDIEELSAPDILPNGCYLKTKDRHKIKFVNDLSRNKIFKDYFIKMRSFINKLTSDKALQILNEARGMAPNDNWIEHSICVGDTAAIIADALNLDSDYAKSLGYIHDIGKRYGWNKGDGVLTHAVKGYEYINSLGYSNEANVCITHSFLNNDINCLSNTRDFTDPNSYKYDFAKHFIENHNYNIYEKIINLCDLMCKDNYMGLDNRLNELVERHGKYKNTEYHLKEAYKLKEYFDNLLGYDLNELFENQKKIKR